jgi:transcriptional regulator with XRE-family HTH domain
VAKLREAAGISARKLSLAIGASHGVIAQLELGTIADLRSDLTLALARALGTTIEHLLTGNGTDPAPEETRAAFDAASAARASAPAAVAA